MPEREGADAATVDAQQGTQTVELGGRSWMRANSNFPVRSDQAGETLMVPSKWEAGAEPALDWTW